MAHSKLTCSSANHRTEKDFVQPIALGPGSASDGHFDIHDNVENKMFIGEIFFV